MPQQRMTREKATYYYRAHANVQKRFDLFCRRCKIPRINYKNKSFDGEKYFADFGSMKLEYIAPHREYYRIIRLEKPDTKSKEYKIKYSHVADLYKPTHEFVQITGKYALNKEDLYCFFRAWELSYNHYKSYGEHKP